MTALTPRIAMNEDPPLCSQRNGYRFQAVCVHCVSICISTQPCHLVLVAMPIYMHHALSHHVAAPPLLMSWQRTHSSTNASLAHTAAIPWYFIYALYVTVIQIPLYHAT